MASSSSIDPRGPPSRCDCCGKVCDPIPSTAEDLDEEVFGKRPARTAGQYAHAYVIEVWNFGDLLLTLEDPRGLRLSDLKASVLEIYEITIGEDTQVVQGVQDEDGEGQNGVILEDEDEILEDEKGSGTARLTLIQGEKPEHREMPTPPPAHVTWLCNNCWDLFKRN